MKYRSKVVEVEAMKLTRSFADVILQWMGLENIKQYSLGEFQEDACYIDIKTLEGIMRASEGDYIIKGLVGEFYPCKADVFHMKYEAVK